MKNPASNFGKKSDSMLNLMELSILSFKFNIDHRIPHIDFLQFPTMMLEIHNYNRFFQLWFFCFFLFFAWWNYFQLLNWQIGDSFVFFKWWLIKISSRFLDLYSNWKFFDTFFWLLKLFSIAKLAIGNYSVFRFSIIHTCISKCTGMSE